MTRQIAIRSGLRKQAHFLIRCSYGGLNTRWCNAVTAYTHFQIFFTEFNTFPYESVSIWMCSLTTPGSRASKPVLGVSTI